MELASVVVRPSTQIAAAQQRSPISSTARLFRRLKLPVLFLLTMLFLAAGQPLWAQPQDASEITPKNPFPDSQPVPAGILDGGTEWLNTSAPIDLKDLRGKVVLLDFWTYCCINCMHVLPDLKYLEEKYASELVVIGVHSAKFDNEKLTENIRDAILRYEIKHPVVNDSEMKIWRKFGTRAWPTLALIDPEGNFVGAQGGEGHRELFDLVIGELVTYHRWKGTLDEDPVVFSLEQSDVEPTALRYPGKVLADEESDRLFISDSNHNRIVTTKLDGTLLDVIGSGQPGRNDGSYIEAEFDHPQGMALVDNKLYVADTENHLIRAVDLEEQTVTTLAGTGSQGHPRETPSLLASTRLNSPWDICHIDGTLYIAMAGPHQIWSHEIGSNEVSIFAGNGREDVINGPPLQSSFAQPSGLAAHVNGTCFYVADSEGSAIRCVPTNQSEPVTTLAGTSELPRGQSLFAFGDEDSAGSDARFQHPLHVAWHSDDILFVADAYNHKIRRIDVGSAEVTTWLGDGLSGKAIDPVQLNEPGGLSVTGSSLFIADTNNHRILKADLESREVTLVEITDLTPPTQTVRKRRIPDAKDAVILGTQEVAAADEVTVLFQPVIRSGYKLNEDYPITWELFLIEGDQIVSASALEGRGEAAVENGVASFSVPLTGESGTATVMLETSYGYCDTPKGRLCRLATDVWKFDLLVTSTAASQQIRLELPSVEESDEEAESDD